MQILLTGGLGFIGRNFLLHRPKNWQVTSLDIVEDKKFQAKIPNAKFYQINLIKKNEVLKLSQKLRTKFDVCLYLAANGDPALSVPDPLWDLQMTTETLINVGTSFDIKKLIYLSSGAVYEGNKNNVNPKSIVDPALPYAITHKASEEYVRFFYNSKKVKKYVVIRFFGAYGPYEPKRKIYSNLVRAFGIKKNSEYTLRGDGKNLIDAMYVEDAVEGLSQVIKSKKANLLVDFCKGDHPSINQLVKTAGEIFNQKVIVKHEGEVPEYNNFYASNKEFQRIFGFKPNISLSQGLNKIKEHIQNE